MHGQKNIKHVQNCIYAYRLSQPFYIYLCATQHSRIFFNYNFPSSVSLDHNSYMSDDTAVTVS